jgi:hypothetical protein
MKTISAAFVKAKKAFGPALKDRTNPAFRSKYADLGACIDAVEEALHANGIVLVQETSLDDTGVTVETVLLHESGESMRFGKLHVPASKSDPQGYGSALTYCRRYSLCASMGIAPEDDDGNAAAEAAKRAAEAKKRQDEATSPSAVAKRLTAQAEENLQVVAEVIAGWERDAVQRIWPFIPKETQHKLTPLIRKIKEAA